MVATLEDEITQRPDALDDGNDGDGEGDSDSDYQRQYEDQEDLFDLTIHFHGSPHSLRIPRRYTVSQLAESIEQSMSIERSKQKIMITPKPGILKFPFPDTRIEDLLQLSSSMGKGKGTKVTLFGSTDKEIGELEKAITSAGGARGYNGRRVGGQSLARGTAAATASPSKYRDWQKIADESKYTFHTITPLPYLPNPSKSLKFLQRLAADPGIKSAMRTHRFSVGLLTEMNPAEHTTQESRTLGLNRNAGEVIELRLRTDRYDGYRDYKVIRNTLCHELAHNVFGEHDRHFWDLTNQIEKEVERGDWTRGGNRLTEEEFYNPEDDGEGVRHDSGGWTGGEYVLGRASSHGGDGTISNKSNDDVGNEGFSRREILARAALSRLKKGKSVKQEQQQQQQQQQQQARGGGSEKDKPSPSSS